MLHLYLQSPDGPDVWRQLYNMCGRSPTVQEHRQREAALTLELQELREDNSRKAALVLQLEARRADLQEEHRQLQQMLDQSNGVAGAYADGG